MVPRRRARRRSSRPAASAGASGLEPPPHLVGERARALDVLDRGGLVCARPPPSPRACRRVAARPAPLRLAPGDEPGIDALAEHLALAGLRAGRAGRGARPVRRARRARRRVPDDRPRAAPHRALRRRDRADPRVLAVHPARAPPGRRGDRLSGRRAAAASSSRSTLADDDEDDPASPRRPRRRRSPGRRDLVWSPDEVRGRLGRGGTHAASIARRRGRAVAAPAGPAVLVRRAAAGARGARAVGGRERAQRPAAPGARRRRRVPAPRRGAAPAAAPAPRRGAHARAGGGARTA